VQYKSLTKLLTDLSLDLFSSTSTEMTVNAKLFTPTRVGNVTLAHRVVLAPLTRFRVDDAHVHTQMGVEHYAQRAAVRGTMLIAEATVIAPQAGGMSNVPGIYTEEQIAAWKAVSEIDVAR
jgi:NADPH2 dehydrogenase